MTQENWFELNRLLEKNYGSRFAQEAAVLLIEQPRLRAKFLKLIQDYQLPRVRVTVRDPKSGVTLRECVIASLAMRMVRLGEQIMTEEGVFVHTGQSDFRLIYAKTPFTGLRLGVMDVLDPTVAD